MDGHAESLAAAYASMRKRTARMLNSVSPSPSRMLKWRLRRGGEAVGANKWRVERLLAKRVSLGRPAGDTHRKGTVLYEVLWAGCREDEASWEPMSFIGKDAIDEFEHTQVEEILGRR